MKKTAFFTLPQPCALTGAVWLPREEKGETALTQHPGGAGARAARGGVGRRVVGLFDGQLAQRDLEQIAALEVGFQRQVGIVPLEQYLFARLRREGAHGDEGVPVVDAGAACGQGRDVPRHDVFDHGVQMLAHAQIVGQVVQGIVDHKNAPLCFVKSPACLYRIISGSSLQ